MRLYHCSETNSIQTGSRIKNKGLFLTDQIEDAKLWGSRTNSPFLHEVIVSNNTKFSKIKGSRNPTSAEDSRAIKEAKDSGNDGFIREVPIFGTEYCIINPEVIQSTRFLTKVKNSRKASIADLVRSLIQ